MPEDNWAQGLSPPALCDFLSGFVEPSNADCRLGVQRSVFFKISLANRNKWMIGMRELMPVLKKELSIPFPYVQT
jgi:hypothetical protein